jgi:hypothetical protein
MQGNSYDLAPEVQQDLAAYAVADSKYPEGWERFCKQLDADMARGKWEVVARMASNVLKIFLYSADSVAFKAPHYSIPPHNATPYADVTQFVRVWPTMAGELVAVQGSLQQKGEDIAEKVLRAQDKYHCFRCGSKGTHLNSMCFVKRKDPFRSDIKHLGKRNYEREPEPEEDGAGFGRRRFSSSRERSGSKQRSEPRRGYGR